MAAEHILQADKIEKYFYDPVKFKVLNNISFTINRGEFVALIGKSGCGKSTLLYILSTMDTGYEGTLKIEDKLITGQDKDKLAILRNEKIGFVFQFHYLLPEFSCLKNVMIPALKLGMLSRKENRRKSLC
jgi:lipoprotein-releasing system ATP-binding protein